MQISVHSLKQVVPAQGQHPLDYLDERYGEAWLYVGRAAIYKGRRLKASPLANPFRVSVNQPRGASVERYRVWLWAQLQRSRQSDEFIHSVLGHLMLIAEGWITSWREPKMALFCWCEQPGPCHAHVIASAAKWLLTPEGQRFLHALPE